MKVKLFSKQNPLGKKGENQLDLENEINYWLQKNPSIKVIGFKQSATSWTYPHLFVSIWHEEGT